MTQSLSKILEVGSHSGNDGMCVLEPDTISHLLHPEDGMLNWRSHELVSDTLLCLHRPSGWTLNQRSRALGSVYRKEPGAFIVKMQVLTGVPDPQY